MRASTVKKARSLPWCGIRQSEEVISYALFLFVSGSVGGWCLELVFRSVSCGGLQLPGFLYGPYCPIYGAGVLLVTLLHRRAGKMQAFCRIVLAASVLEYVTSWFFETFFHRLLWDYSALPLSIGTRVSLPFSLAWGALGLAFCAWVEPRLRNICRRFPGRTKLISGIVLTAMVFDTLLSIL